METLFYFILGVLFVTLVLPLLEAATGLFTTWIEKIRGKQEVEILKLQQLAQKGCGESTYAIGFDTSCGITREDLEEEEEEEEDE